ncbi:MAG TPA: response regulator transcription factor [Sedimentisphaerales bacterium]|nr:response regulator transcription factor [Sedimentisphaerales bacterium]
MTPSEIRVGLEHESCSLLIVCLDDEQDERFELVKQAKTPCPSTPILALVKPGDVPLAVAVMKAGAADCLETSVEAATLRSAILGLLEQYSAADRSTSLGLTQTESVVLDHILEGRTSRQIADMLHRSTRTVEVHRRAIMRKLGVSNVIDLFRCVTSLGLITHGSRLIQNDFTQAVGT